MNHTFHFRPARTTFTRLVFTILLTAFICFSGSSSGSAAELISNGNFESGTFSGWSVPSFPSGVITNSGSWVIDVPGTTTPLSGHTTAGNAMGGGFYAVTDQTFSSTHVLSQTFTVPTVASSVILSFQMFANDYDSGPIVDPIGLDHTGPANQHARVDILSSTASPLKRARACSLTIFSELILEQTQILTPPIRLTSRHWLAVVAPIP